MQNPFQTNLQIENFFKFFFKNQFFSLFRTLYCKGEKHEVRKKSFLVLFYSANPFQTNLRFENFFKFFFLKKHQFFSLFRTLYCKGEKHEVRKKSFLVLFYSAKSISVQFTIWELFQVFFSKNINFFHCFEPYTAKVRSMRSEKNHF